MSLVGLAGAAALLARRAMAAFERRVDAKVKSFTEKGYCIVDSAVSPRVKRRAWVDVLLPHLVPFWRTNHDGFVYSDSSSHPRRDTGKYYNMSCHDTLPGLPRLVDSSYEAQLVLALVLDPSCRTVHFGRQTHFFLKWRIRPLWALLGQAFAPKEALQLEGDAQSWHIVVFPSPGSGPVPNGVHIDSGLAEKSYEYLGLPVVSGESATSTEALMVTLLQQLCVIFYCETPGRLTAAAGATGVLEGAHLALLEALRGMAEPLPWRRHAAALKRFGQGRVVRQLELDEGHCALVCGLLPHTAMLASTLVEGRDVRVMQNLKVAATLQQRMHPRALLRLVRALPPDSPLRLMCQRQSGALGVAAEEGAHAYRRALESDSFGADQSEDQDAYSAEQAAADRQTYETLCEALITL